MPVTRMLASERGMRNFQAKRCSWSSRNRGRVNRTQKMMKPSSITLANIDAKPISSRAHPREPPPAEEEHRRQPGEGERGGELADEEHEEPHPRVLGHVPGDQFGL